jgi:hypothetical protein
MIRILGICAVVLVAAVAYTQLTGSAHDEAVSHLKQQLSETSTQYTSATCSTKPSPANQFAIMAFGNGATLFNCQVVHPDGTIETICEAVGGTIPSNTTASDAQPCSRIGSLPRLPTGLTPGVGGTN